MRKKIAVLVGRPDENLQNAFLQGFLMQAFSDDADVCIFATYLKRQLMETRGRADSRIFSLVEYDMFEAVVVMADTIQTKGVLERVEEELHERCTKPVIFVNKESRYFPSVTADNYLPVKKMISHLIEKHGFTDIAFLTGNENNPHAVRRLQAFTDCMREHSLEVADNRIFYGDFWFNSGTATAEQLLRDREHLPQAVACANDYMAVGLIRRLTEEGIRVPEDIAVTGYDASEVGRDEPISVTSMPMPVKECGEYCARYVKAQASGEELPEFSAEVEPFIGRSCGCSREKAEAEDKNGSAENNIILSDLMGGTMEDDLLMQTEAQGLVNTVFSYVYQIRPFEEFHLCLNSDWAAEDFGSEACDGYTERMLDVVRCGPAGQGLDKVSLEIEFDRKLLLPESAWEGGRPHAYYFTPLFFEEHCFGYAAVSYGEEPRCYDVLYKRWLGIVMRGMECFWRLRSLSMQNAMLETSLVRDSLTGFYNYRGFLKNGVASLQKVSDTGGFVKITALELCDFNEIYRTLGSQEGDRVITDFAQILAIAAQKEMICYLGNGEFLVAEVSVEEMEDSADPAMEAVAGKLAEYSHSNGLEGKLWLISAVVSGQADTEERLGNLVGEAISKKNADKIKKQRQEASSLTEDESRKLELVADILDNNRLIYYFQPIVDAGTGEIFAYEALMRADTAERISPLDILKYAEHLGRLSDVESATFINILNYLEAHEEQFAHRKVFINSIPGTQVSDEDARTIQEKLKKFSGEIVVELTEQAEMGDEELEELKKKYARLGVNTAVDDYGTGYSNVYNLLRYMPDFVKIDRMLLASIQLSAQKQHFVKEIIEFSHNNRIAVLAEGVETAEELKMVTLLGVDLIQGYYTARPNAEVVSKIDLKIQNEIVQYGQDVLKKDRRKVYQAGQDSSISLIKLASAHYFRIRFTPEDAPHRDISLQGLQGFSANMEIEIEDGYCGRIELKDVDLAVYNEQPAIRLGKGCDVTLALSGENIIEQGGILVPEGSKLTVQGDGNLLIRQIAINGYGIGNAMDAKCGDLHFEQDGLIRIQGNVMHGVGIGAGLGGSIRIDRGMYSLQLAGEEAVGIGSLYSDVELSIHSCALEFGMRSSVHVGVGSIKGSVALDAMHIGVNGTFSASRCVCIGTLEGSEFRFDLAHATGELTAHSQSLCGIGSLSGDTVLRLNNFSFKMYMDGDEAIAMGNLAQTAEIRIHTGNMTVEVRNGMDFDIGARTFEMVNGYNRFILNDKEVVREVTRETK